MMIIDSPVPPPVIRTTSPSTPNILEGCSGESMGSVLSRVVPVFERTEAMRSRVHESRRQSRDDTAERISVSIEKAYNRSFIL